MSFFNAIFIALNFHTPVAKSDVNEIGRYERMKNIAYIVEEISNKATCSEEFKDDKECKPIFNDRYLLSALILSLGKNETYFKKDIQAGNCSRFECGGTKLINGKKISKAHSYFQVERSPFMSMEEFDDFVGLNIENLRKVVWYVAKRLAGAYSVCHNTLEGTFSAYAKSQTTCEWSGSKQRAKDALYYKYVILNNLN